jgi:hypothetical protein
MLENAPSYSAYLAAKQTYEAAAAAHGGQSQEAIEAGVAYAQLEVVCANEVGIIISP